MKIVTVLRHSLEFTSDISQWFARQLPNIEVVCLTDLPAIPNVITTPLMYNDLKGWWAKLELFNPDHLYLGKEDILFFDLDTVILDPTIIDKMSKARDFTMLRDWYDPTTNNSSIMYIPASIKPLVWETFIQNKDKIMRLLRPLKAYEVRNAQLMDRHLHSIRLLFKQILPYNNYVFNRFNVLGDQAYISAITSGQCKYWGDSVTGIYSYKKHIVGVGEQGYGKFSKGDGTLPKDAKIICFHGNPRPFNLNKSWVPR